MQTYLNQQTLFLNPCKFPILSKTHELEKVQKINENNTQTMQIQTNSEEQNSSVGIYLINIKKQLCRSESKIFMNQIHKQKTLKKLCQLFIDYSRLENESGWKIVLTCINLICIMLHNKSKNVSNTFYQSIFRKRTMLNSLLNMPIQHLIAINPKIQNSICYLFCLIANYQELVKYNYIIRYKEVLAGLLNCSNDNVKIVYNTLKVIHDLQIRGLITQKDFLKYDLLNKIKIKMSRSDSINVQQICFKILIKQNKFSDILNFIRQDEKNVLEIELEILYKILIENEKLITVNEVFQIMKVKTVLNSSLEYFYKFLDIKIKSFSSYEFTLLIENGLFEHLQGKWVNVKQYFCQAAYINLIYSILQKGKNLYYFNGILQKLQCIGFMLDFIDCTRNCTSKQLYVLLKKMYDEFLRQSIPEDTPITRIQ